MNVRIYQGIHFRTADEAGRKQGRSVAKWVFHHFLRPLDDDAMMTMTTTMMTTIIIITTASE